MSKTVIKKPCGEIWCYGKIEEDSNFSVVCKNEANDCVAPGLENPDGEPVRTWNQVVKALEKDGYDIRDIEQIEAC